MSVSAAISFRALHREYDQLPKGSLASLAHSLTLFDFLRDCPSPGYET